jgi:hypothetical protein
MCPCKEIETIQLTQISTASDKQARLLSTEAGHFSLIRALHAADFITELNGTFTPCPIAYRQIDKYITLMLIIP